MSNVLHRSLRSPPRVAASSHGIYIIDLQGRRYLDASGGAAVSCLGHAHPDVLAAMHAQIDKLAYAHTSFFTSEVSEALADHLVERAPEGLDHVYFVSGGSEAMEAALKLARQYFVEIGEAERTIFVARRQSYHGNTLGALAVGGNEWRRRQFAPLLMDVGRVSPCYEYRDRAAAESQDAYTQRLLAELEQKFEELGPERVIAFIAEPVVGASAGGVVPPPGYYQTVREICDRHGVLFIADEVMSGVGRTGRWFGIEHWPGVSPDIITCGKGVTSGYIPGGAVLARGRLADEVNGRGAFPHGFTYSHHPVVAAVGLAVLRYVERHGLVAKAEAAGVHLMKRLGGLLDLPAVGEVRGLGLLTAVEIVADRKTRASYPSSEATAERIQAEAMRRGVVVYASGGQDQGAGDLLLVGPPFMITNDQIDETVSTLGDAIAAVTRA
jgi:adenosylmethionine-8-amino-7-oxononanoate aminotransferase